MFCSFCSAEYAGTGGGFPAGRTVACLDRAEEEGMGRGEEFPCKRCSENKVVSCFYCNIHEQQRNAEQSGSWDFFLPCVLSLAFLTGMSGWHDRSHDCQYKELCPRLELNNWMIEDK